MSTDEPMPVRPLRSAGEDLIERLRGNPAVEVAEAKQAWELRVTSPSGLVFEITVPRFVFEWFLIVRDVATGEEIWNDWMDYYPNMGEPAEKMSAEMNGDIEWFTGRILSLPLRVVDAKFPGHHHRLEWEKDGAWLKATMYDPAPATSNPDKG